MEELKGTVLRDHTGPEIAHLPYPTAKVENLITEGASTGILKMSCFIVGQRLTLFLISSNKASKQGPKGSNCFQKPHAEQKSRIFIGRQKYSDTERLNSQCRATPQNRRHTKKCANITHEEKNQST